jgi:hypothetical protein
MVLEEGRMEAHSKLQGEKRVSLKPPMEAPAIAWSHELITQGHIKGRDSMSLSSTLEFSR